MEIVQMAESTKPAPQAIRGRITQLLQNWNEGDLEAAEELLPLVYETLRRIASSYFQRERCGHTLQATAIVHEAYVELIENNGIVWKSRSHFIGFMARLMRRVLVDHVRARRCGKRGGQDHKVTLAEANSLSMEKTPDLIALHDALLSLEEIDPRKASLVELRFFGGLSVEETADALKVSRATAIREWRRAKAWLYRELEVGDLS